LRNIAVQYFDTLEDVKSYILKTVPIECTIGIGHSATLQKINITHSLLERENIVYDKELAQNLEECKLIKKNALTADWYITSSNAISLDGRIVNVDHNGNRVVAISFGPDNVIIVVGRIEDFDILQKYQRKGFGTSVLKHLLEEARANCVEFVYLITDSGDTAKEMYKKCGFKKAGEKTELFFDLS